MTFKTWDLFTNRQKQICLAMAAYHFVLCGVKPRAYIKTIYLEQEYSQ